MRLIHGDCLQEMDNLIAEGDKVDVIITDPPYGTTACKWDSIIPLDEMWPRLWELIKPNGAIVLFGSEPFSSALRMSSIKNYKYDWIWIKEKGLGFLNSQRMPLRDTENISVFYKEQPTYNPQKVIGMKPYNVSNSPDKQKGTNGVYKKVESKSDGERYPLTTLRYNRVRNPIHPTQKPVELIEYLIKTYTVENEVVLDFTMGSGTTGVACKKTNRDFIGIELDEEYYNIAKKRIRKQLNIENFLQ